MFVLSVPVGAAARCFPSFGYTVEGVPRFLCVLPLFCGFILSLCQYCTHLILAAWGGITAGRGLSRVGPVNGVCNVVEDPFISYPYLCCRWPLGHRKALK